MYFKKNIKTLVKNIRRDVKITKDASCQLSSAMEIICEKICELANKITYENKLQTITQKAISCSGTILLKGQLSKFATDEPEKINEKLKSGQNPEEILVLNTQYAKDCLEKFGDTTELSAMSVTSIIEYLCNEILSVAIDRFEGQTLNIDKIFTVIQDDEEISKTFSEMGIMFLSYSTIPTYHPRPRRRVSQDDGEEVSPSSPRSPAKENFLQLMNEEQSKYNTACIDLKSFENYCHELLQDYIGDGQISKDSLKIMQYYIEKKLIHYLKFSDIVSHYTRRQTVYPRDLMIVDRITGDLIL